MDTETVLAAIMLLRGYVPPPGVDGDGWVLVDPILNRRDDLPEGLSPDARVYVIWDGMNQWPDRPERAGDFFWGYSGGVGDILAWRYADER